jgi:hypothetical protein
MESPIKKLWKLFYYEKTKNIFWFVNNSEYHHREMGLMTGKIRYMPPPIVVDLGYFSLFEDFSL